MATNPILEELYAIRKQLMARYGDDMAACLEDARRRALASDRALFLPNRSEAMRPGPSREIEDERLSSHRTAGVKQLVEAALEAVAQPFSEDVVDEVFAAIADNPDWRQRYDDLCIELGKTVVNKAGGYWIGRAVGSAGRGKLRRQTI